MFVITNRRLNPRARGYKVFEATPNEQGPNELRVVEVRKNSQGNDVFDVIPDTLTTKKYLDPLGIKVERAKKLKEQGNPVYASRYAAEMLLNRLNPKTGPGKNLVFLIHGYNTDIRSAVQTAEAIEEEHKVEVLVFSWPSMGGGSTRAKLNYLEDKQDAQASAPALNRVFRKMHHYLVEARADYVDKLEHLAVKRGRGDRDREADFVARKIEEMCPFRLTMLAFSMGNYLLKQSLKTTTSSAPLLIFDNIVLAAADANNQDHSWWVDSLQVRNRLYVTINEDDRPLRVSRMKPGGKQLARLGAYVRNLDAEQAYYVDFTDAEHVGGAHNYFSSKNAMRNGIAKHFFHQAFNGLRGELQIPYDVASNTYRVRDA